MSSIFDFKSLKVFLLRFFTCNTQDAQNISQRKLIEQVFMLTVFIDISRL